LPHQDLVFEHLLDIHICVIASQLVSKEDEERRYFVSTQYLGKLLLLLQHLLLGVIISQLVLKRNEGIKCHFNIYYITLHYYIAAATARPGGALDQAYDRKMRDTADACRQQGLVFLPIALETLGGMHHQAISQFKRLGAAMARHTGSDEREIVSQLVQRISLHLMRGNAAMITSRRPDVDFLPPEIDGVE